jgi:hypothetical protein
MNMPVMLTVARVKLLYSFQERVLLILLAEAVLQVVAAQL